MRRFYTSTLGGTVLAILAVGCKGEPARQDRDLAGDSGEAGYFRA